MRPGEGNSDDFEVCFTISPDSRTNQVTMVKPDQIFYGNKSEDIVFKVKADSEEEAKEKAYKMLSDPGGQYLIKYGPGLEVKTKYVWKIFHT